MGTELGLPAELLQAVKGVYDKLQADVQQQLEQAREEHRIALQVATNQVGQGEAANRLLTDTNAALSLELAQTKDALVQLQAAHHAQNVTLATVQAENAGLQQRLTDRAAEVSALNHQLSQTRAQFEHYQEATAAQRVQERQAAEQRISRLEQELAAAHRHIAAQQSTIGQQEARIAYLTADNAGLQQELHTVREDLGAVRSGQERLSYQLEETTLARQSLASQFDAAQTLLTEGRMTLAARENETGMLSENLWRMEARVDTLAEEKLTLLQQQGSLQMELRQCRELVDSQRK